MNLQRHAFLVFYETKGKSVSNIHRPLLFFYLFTNNNFRGAFVLDPRYKVEKIPRSVLKVLCPIFKENENFYQLLLQKYVLNGSCVK